MFVTNSNHKVRFAIRCCLSKRAINNNLLKEIVDQEISFYMINDRNTMNPFGAFYEFCQDAKNYDFDFLVILEDDVIINKYMKENINNIIEKFKYCSSKLNLLYLSVDSHNDYFIGANYNRKFKLFCRKEIVHYSAGIIVSKDFLIRFSEFIEKENLFELERNFDLKISEFCIKEHGFFFLKRPSIVASNKSCKSIMNNKHVPLDNQFSYDSIFT